MPSKPGRQGIRRAALAGRYGPVGGLTWRLAGIGYQVWSPKPAA